MTETRICVICGREYTPRARNSVTCSAACSQENKHRLETQNTYERKAMRARREAICETARNTSQALAEDCKAARAAGLSYGQWRARGYASYH